MEYLWIVRPLGPEFVVLRVWAADRERRDFPLEARVRFDDPWLNFGPIIAAPRGRAGEIFALTPVAPRRVADIIRGAIAAGWGPHHPVTPRRFEVAADGTLARADDRP